MPLYAEDRVALLAADHRLARAKSISITQLRDGSGRHASRRDRGVGGVPQPEPAPGRPRRPEGPTASNLAEKLEIVAAGTAISFVPSSVATAARLQPGVATVPVRHIPPTQVCLAWNSARHARLVAGFADATRDVTKG